MTEQELDNAVRRAYIEYVTEWAVRERDYIIKRSALKASLITIFMLSCGCAVLFGAVYFAYGVVSAAILYAGVTLKIKKSRLPIIELDDFKRHAKIGRQF